MTIADTFDGLVVKVLYKLEARNGVNAGLANPLVEIPEVIRWQISHHRDQLTRQMTVTLGPKVDPDASALMLYSDEKDVDNPIQQYSEVKFTMTVYHPDGTTDDVVLFWGYITDIHPSRGTVEFVAEDKLFRLVNSITSVDFEATKVPVPLVGGSITLRQNALTTNPDELEVNPVTHPLAWNGGATARRAWLAEGNRLYFNGVAVNTGAYLIEPENGRVTLAEAFVAGVWTLDYLTVYQEGTNEIENILAAALMYAKASGGPGFLIGDLDLDATGITAAAIHWHNSDGTIEELWRTIMRDFLPPNYVLRYDPNTDKVTGRYVYMDRSGAITETTSMQRPPAVPPPVPDCIVNARRAVEIDTPRNTDGLATMIVIRAEKRVDEGVGENLPPGSYALCNPGVGDGTWTADAGEALAGDGGKLVDHNLNNRVRYFKDLGGSEECPTYYPWFTIDLGVPTSLTKISATSPWTLNDQNFSWYLRVEGSEVGIAGPWRIVGSAADNVKLSPSKQTVSITEFYPTAWAAIRVQMRPCKDIRSGGDRSVALAEFQLFGTTQITDPATGEAPNAKVIVGVPPFGSPDIQAPTAYNKTYHTVGYVTKVVSQLSVLGLSSAKEFANLYLNETIRLYQKATVECSLTTEIGLWSYVQVVDPFNVHSVGNVLDLLVEDVIISADRVRFTGTNYAAGVIE